MNNVLFTLFILLTLATSLIAQWDPNGSNPYTGTENVEINNNDPDFILRHTGNNVGESSIIYSRSLPSNTDELFLTYSYASNLFGIGSVQNASATGFAVNSNGTTYIRNNADIYMEGTNAAKWLFWRESGVSKGYVGHNGTDVFLRNSETGGDLFLGANNSTDLTIKDGGKIGLGTSNPTQAHVHIDGGSHALKLDDASPFMSFYNGTDYKGYLWHANASGFVPAQMVLMNNKNSPLQLGTNGLNRVTITGAGDVGIGDATPSAKLDVNGDVRTTGQIIMNSGGANNGLFGETGTRRFTMGTATTTLASNAFFEMFGNETQPGGIPARAGELNFAGQYLNFRSGVTTASFGNLALRIWQNNDFQVYSSTTLKQGNTNWTTFSDKNLKSNIRSYKGGLEEVMKINPVWFTYSDESGLDNSREFVGIIAQEYQKLAPQDVYELDMTDDDGVPTGEKYLGANDSAVKYMLVNALKEQQAIIDIQKEDLKAKNELIDKLLVRLEVIENKITSTNTAEENNTGLESLDSDVINVTLTGKNLPALEQNTPNPFDNETSINYYIPEQSNQSSIQIFDINGNVIKNVSINNTGNGTLSIEAYELPAGSYTYSLIIDNKRVDSKQMVITK